MRNLVLTIISFLIGFFIIYLSISFQANSFSAVFSLSPRELISNLILSLIGSGFVRFIFFILSEF